MKISIPRIILYAMLSSIVFALGRAFGYNQCKEIYGYDYEFQSMQIDTLNKKAKILQATYDSIKKSPCYKVK